MSPKFQSCCHGGKVKLPLIGDPPVMFRKLLFDSASTPTKNYRTNTRTYNVMFSFTSPGMKFDTKFTKGGGPPTLRLHGQTYHRIWTMLPEINHQNMHSCIYSTLTMKFKTGWNVSDGRLYNEPIIYEVATLIVGDIDSCTKRDIVIQAHGVIYTTEFQKRGLPHAHILIFLHPQSKYPNPTDIDKIISCEIPNPELHPRLYKLVKQHMMHVPCGLARLSSPCMKNKKCSKFYPKKFNETTIVDYDGFPQYRRRSNTHTIVKNGISLDNKHVVSYNKRLLLKYQGHTNMELCNQCSTIKYLFKYIHKGFDRITTSIVQSKGGISTSGGAIDEIQQYLDCRHVSPNEACLRIFSLKIHARKPAAERMFYHLIGEKTIFFTEHATMEDVLEKASVIESTFTAWMITNQKFEDARTLTYGQFVSKFVYEKRTRSWKPRKKGFTIGRLIWVPPTTGGLFFLRMMLTVVKGPTTYEDIHKVGGTQYFTFRDACFAMGFLEDDREFLLSIKEASV
ncbi:hypothetical protein KIW84_011659 [Lathyrus oleraceus]|uniref:Helitron helicase-like domain-containing protein n=1 Tax=Pisum sativum TaxID=3888 RepID=A0A9D5BFK6_PEA|nr:hypothetical protein KIW84_011659 [Pisum sativum]